MTEAIQRKELLGHPVGLFILFFTEMWERFSYYGMRAILVLFLVAQTDEGSPLAGLGWEQSSALELYGWYTMAVYVASIPGGWIADRMLGQRKAVMVGGLTLCVGHIILAVHGSVAFFTGLALIVAGVGLLKPNISTMVGGLYSAKDPRRDKGFTIFYIGINIGAFLAGLIVGYIGEQIGWHYGFGLAGIGMLAGQAVYIMGQKHLAGIGELDRSVVDKKTTGKAQPLTKIEKDRIVVLLLSFVIVIVFWGAFEQAGGLMNIIAKDRTDRLLFGMMVPASWFQSLNPLFIMIFGTVVGAFWYSRKIKSKESSSLFKMAIGTMIMGTGFIFMVFATEQAESAGKAAMYWLGFAYLFHTIGELCASPVALSFITKLAPARYGSIMMGVYFAVTGLGNKVAGLIGEAAVGGAGEKTVFISITLFCVLFGAIILLFLRKLNLLTHGAEEVELDAEAGAVAEA